MTITYDQITSNTQGFVFYRVVTEENNEISYHRGSLYPGQDTIGLPSEIINLCNAIWTDAVIAAYKQSLSE